ncbi:ribokinase [Longirhabdus pacifica]|uniref:ribokinase n=1 Tax=Longirhabdus pacifica TaxID=2305227 RepID=UPI00100939BD|nr:ribokinase [Longirhabdus pacifica]
MNNIVVVGSASIDLVTVSSKRPKAGETVIGEAFHTVPGGKGANQAVAAARLGANVAMVGAVGTDTYGNMILENFKNEKILSKHMKKVTDVTTGTAHIVLAEKDNSIVVIPGANALVDKELVEQTEELIKGASIVLLQLEVPIETVQIAIDLCHEHAIPVMLNPAPAQKISPAMLEKVSYITPNEHEVRIILNDFDSPIESLLRQYPNKLIVTEGEKGVRYFDGENIIHVPSLSVEVVDTTGAGDTFNGALAVALSEGQQLKQAIQFANAAAGLSVTKLGAQGGMPNLQQVHAAKEQLS